MPVDPQRLAQDARVSPLIKAMQDWYGFVRVNGSTPSPDAKDWDELIAAICAAHLDALAGETEGLDFWKAQALCDAADNDGDVYDRELDRQHRALLAAAVAQARAEERERMVRWLRARGESSTADDLAAIPLPEVTP